MRLLVVSAAKLGVKHAVDNLLRELRERGHELTYLTLPTHEAPADVERVTLRRRALVDAFDGHGAAHLGYSVLGFWRAAYERVAEMQAAYDAVWFHTPRLLALAPTEVAGKSLVTYHNHLRAWKADNHGFPASAYYRLCGTVERRGIRAFAAAGARFTVVYDAVTEELTGAGVARNAVGHVGNGVNLDRFTPDGEPGGNDAVAPDALADGAGGNTFLSLGSLTEQKRPIGLLDAFERLQATTDERHRLLVAGDGPLRRKAEARAESVPGVSFLGFVEEDTKPNLYRTVDYFVLPSRYEGEPLVLYEALASGTPAIVADIPNLRFVEAADCGAVVDFDDPERAAAGLREYVERDTEDHGVNARMYAQSNLSWGVAADKYHAVLETIGGEGAC